jgi:GNAT superfamily N-acetyltransferase
MTDLLTITLENPHDPICLALIAELSAELAARYPEDASEGQGAFSPDDVTVPRSAFVVAWLDDRPVGCGALRPMADPSQAEVKRMFVRPSARGRGISRRVLAQLELLAGEFGFRTVILETGTRQLEAISLYKTAGYERVPCYGRYINNPDSICFAKRLAVEAQ